MEVARQQRPRIDYLELSQRLETDCIDYNSVPEGGALSNAISRRLRLDVQQARHVAAIVRERGSEVVFSMSERVAIPLSLMLPREVRHVVDTHHLLSRYKLRAIRAAGIPCRWDLILAHGEAEAEALRDALNLDEERIAWLPDKVDTTFWKPCASDEPDQVFSVGLSYRDYPTLLQALWALPEIPARVHLGSTWVQARGQGSSRDIPPNALVTSMYLSTLDLRDLYARSRLVVISLKQSTLWNAGSNVMLEAQAMGKPVVATRTAGSMTYIRDGETGLLVEPGCPEALAGAIEQLWNDPVRAAKMGAAAREWVTNSFTLDDWFGKIVPILHGTADR